MWIIIMEAAGNKKQLNEWDMMQSVNVYRILVRQPEWQRK